MAGKFEAKTNGASTTELALSAALARVEALENRVAALTNTAPREDEVKKLHEWAILDTQQKNQLESDRLFTDGEPWEVSFTGQRTNDKSPPTVPLIAPIRIRAQDADHAVSRFMELCGITGLAPEVKRPEARKAATSTAPAMVSLAGG